jgi:hypothetical protein
MINRVNFKKNLSWFSILLLLLREKGMKNWLLLGHMRKIGPWVQPDGKVGSPSMRIEQLSTHLE